MAHTLEQTEEGVDDGTQAPPAGTVEPSARLICIDPSVLGDDAAMVIDLCGDALTVGRAVSNSVALKAKGVSRRHARLVCDDGEWAIEDLGSTNGVRVNRKQVAHQRLEAGDVVQIGRARFEYRPTQEPASAGAAAPTEDDSEPTVVISPDVKLLVEDSPLTPPGRRIAPQKPHPRMAASVSGADGSQLLDPRHRKQSDTWVWWLALGIVAILAVAFYLI